MIVYDRTGLKQMPVCRSGQPNASSASNPNACYAQGCWWQPGPGLSLGILVNSPITAMTRRNEG
jgi:hypothetical protein